LRWRIFTDRRIDRLHAVGEDLVLDSTAPGGTAVQVRLRSVSTRWIGEHALRYGVIAARLCGTEGSRIARLTDDDGVPRFEADRADAEVVVAGETPVPQGPRDAAPLPTRRG
jgi:hypothetical protein